MDERGPLRDVRLRSEAALFLTMQISVIRAILFSYSFLVGIRGLIMGVRNCPFALGI
jgi:hypothetical protein